MAFRPLRRTNNAVSLEVAKALLNNERRGVIAVNGEDGYPYAVPVNYKYFEDENKIVFHGARAGQKWEMVQKCDKVCFTVFGNEFFKEGEWAPYMQSTVVFGRCKLVETTAATVEEIRTFAMKYYPNKEEVEEAIAEDIGDVQIYEIEIEHMCGKQVQEK